ncbi:glycosyltransferase [Humibacter albus]|uniref:glycosyltransferase n=1 Tax=Humibacter albus TaxID=427754 RepID=UPI0003F91A74|nr:glycosyltransferase [Humibacter albus]
MRIAMVSEHASPLAAVGSVDAGGQNVHVAALSTALAAQGHDVTVYTRRDAAALPHRVAFGAGVEVVNVDAGPAMRVPKDELLPYIPQLADGIADDWARRGVPDVVHSHFWMSGLAALGAVESMPLAHVPTVHTFHALGVVKRRFQGAADTSPIARQWLEPHVGSRVAAIVATSQDEVRELSDQGIAEGKVHVVPCGVDPAAFSARGGSAARSARYRLLSVGRLVPRKGVDIVIDALARLDRDGMDAELVVLGSSGGAAETAGALDDPEISRLADSAAAAGVADRVRFTGQIDQAALPRWYRSADAVVCTPWYEPFGIVPLEAMACGVPVVAAAVGGLQDTVVDGVTGLLVPPFDADATAAALTKVLTDTALSAELSRAGRARVRENYTWTRVARDTARVYEQLVDAGAPASVAEPAWGGASR